MTRREAEKSTGGEYVTAAFFCILYNDFIVYNIKHIAQKLKQNMGAEVSGNGGEAQILPDSARKQGGWSTFPFIAGLFYLLSPFSFGRSQF